MSPCDELRQKRCVQALALGLGAWFSLAPSTAEACGGTFCDTTLMPVDQSGEDILFIRDGGEIEVHVRVQYEGEAERFAWLVPLRAVPEISVGSQPLFDTMRMRTAPQWVAPKTYECEADVPPPSGGGYFIPGLLDVSAASEPMIIDQEEVGAYEVVVLQGGTAAELITFLEDNDYAQDPQAEDIIQAYLDEGFLFAAVKLTADANTDEIHPLVFRMPGDEPCVPLRLTAIAAEQDMSVRAYFLGAERWGPQNYSHVALNPLAYTWIDQGSTLSNPYLELLGLAVDEAGGRAFSTAYSGPSEIVPTGLIYRQSWDETAFIGLDPIAAIDLIAMQNLNSHPLIQSILLQFVPPPEDIPATQFWNNIEDYAALIDWTAWDAEAFADMLAERIVEPGLHALDALEAWPVLTRLDTTISPVEMTVDPVFQPLPDLPPVSNQLLVDRLDFCGPEGERFSVPVGDALYPVCLAEGTVTWPDVLKSSPAALRIEKLPAVGPPVVLEDHSAEIQMAYAEHAQDNPCGGGQPGTGDSGSDSDSGSGLSTGGGASPGSRPGCSVDAPADQLPARGLALGGLALLGLAGLRCRGRAR